MTAQTFRFKPRYRGVAWTSIGVGGALVGTTLIALGAATLPFVTGMLGIAAGVAYFASPTWKLEVVVDDAGLTVRSPKATKLALAWKDVVKVVHSPSTSTCFVDGGAPEKSLLVPGDNAPAPYDIVDKQSLCDAIVKNVHPDKVETVETLRDARR